ncbi:unnamed protein product [Pseudo-nitzschia multistriata]|uniref:Ketopantoate reductase C-terminal domain-containing protein n=1 Tax=Pseudo-nitzschia multistriata TaxID=183589 RepID=A0A448ZT96_9STRA|nr:unnamed protein product [Pseudo-nitzschia multistriata]
MIHEPIHVLGAGSIGVLWTASIRSRFPSYPIALLLRDHERNRNRVSAAAGAANDGGCGDSDNDGNTLRTGPVPIRHSHELEVAWNNRQAPGGKERLFLPVQFLGDGGDAPPQGPKPERIRTLLVATKAHQARKAVESVLDRLVVPPAEPQSGDPPPPEAAAPARIVLLCNGALSVRDELADLLPGAADGSGAVRLSLATTTHGAFFAGPNELVHAGVGTTFLEDPPGATETTERTVRAWNEAGLRCQALSPREMNAVLWNKLAANCVINPLTSIFRCTNGELLMEPSFPQLREEILAEVAFVAAKAGTTGANGSDETLRHGSDFPTEAKAKATGGSSSSEDDDNRGIPSVDEMRTFVTETILATQHNRSSMYQDIHGGNAQPTEIDHLNGYVVRKGRKTGIECPANEDLCARIAALTAGTDGSPCSETSGSGSAGG